MAFNIMRDPGDYRHYKQPFEIKNLNELQIMTDQEKEMYAEKLKAEIHEHRNREATYEAKRKELLEIENAYRVLQGRQVKQAGDHKGRGQTQIQVIEGLNDQIADFVKKHKLQYGAIYDVKEKINQIKDVISRREEEIDELKRVISNKYEVGRKKEQDIEKLKNEQRDYL